MSEEKAPENVKRNLNITLSSFTMFATPRVRVDKKHLRLMFGCTNGYPNINMETDEEGEPLKENGFLKLSARLNGTNFIAAMGLIKAAVTKEPGWKHAIECYHTWKNGVFSEKPVHVCDLVIGVDNQGLVYITILQSGRTSSKFVFGPTEWHNYKDSDGNNLTQKAINHICATETANGLIPAITAAIALDAVDFQNTRTGMVASTRNDKDGDQKPAEGNGYNQGGQGGYQKKPWDNKGGGGGGGGYQKKPWENRNGGGGGFQKKPWDGGGGGYQKKPWDGGNGGQGGGYQKKPWDNGGQGGQQNNRPAPPDYSRCESSAFFLRQKLWYILSLCLRCRRCPFQCLL